MLRSSLPTVDARGAFGEVLDRATADVSEPAGSWASKVHSHLGSVERSGRVSMRFLAARDSRPIRSGWHRRRRMSPTVFRDGPFRFFFFSREEERLHIDVQSPDGEAKFWIEPQIELARNYELSAQDLSRTLQLVVDHEQEIRDAWHEHFDT
jgi:hypothetical protein